MRPLLSVLILFFCISSKGDAAPRVLVTLPPIHSLVTGVMKDVGIPISLLDGIVSPHHYLLKPSDHRKIENADLLIWIGPNYEFFLEKPLNQSSANTIQLNAIPHLLQLPMRSHNSCSHTHDTESTTVDPHLWLTPINAQKIVEVIADKLSQLDPHNTSRYKKNAAILISKLTYLHQELTQKLAPVKNRPFLVYHDGYQYFEKAYNLEGLGALTVDPEIPISVKRLETLAKHIKLNNVRCIFGETQFYPPLIKTLADATAIKTGKLDPFGTTFNPDETLYFKMMHQLADTFIACLKG
jgi:zinc transport system substrate-binding protein